MSELPPADRRWLDSAVRLARARLGTTGPFPAAAVLIVDETGQFLAGRGVTGAMGRPAAVVAALADARGRTAGATAYLTMEPDADGPLESEAQKLIEAGLARVVVGTSNPDGTRQGRGIGQLREAGLDVLVVDHGPSLRLVEGYAARVGRGRPFVTAMLAVSADGMIAGREGTQVDLLSADARRWVEARRLASDALLTSLRSLERHGTPTLDGDRRAMSVPLLVVMAANAAALPQPSVTHVFLVGARKDLIRGDQSNVLPVAGRNGRPDPRAAMTALAARDVNTVQVEAGARLTEAFIATEVIDRFHLIESTLEIGRGGLPATPLGSIDARLRAVGFIQQDERLLGANRLRSFERSI